MSTNKDENTEKKPTAKELKLETQNARNSTIKNAVVRAMDQRINDVPSSNLTKPSKVLTQSELKQAIERFEAEFRKSIITETADAKEAQEKEFKQARIKMCAKYARNIGQAKIERVCCWIFRWGYADRHIISEVACDDLRYASRLAKRGLLKCARNPDNGRDMYVLTHTGLKIAMDIMAPSLEQYAFYPKYPYADDKRLPWGRVKHSNLIQLAMIRLGCHNEAGSESWFSERELADGTSGAKPDASLIRDSHIWVELERTSKNRESRALQFWQRMEAFMEGNFDKILWVTDGPGLKVEIERQLQKEMCVKAVSDGNGRISLIPSLSEPMTALKNASVVIPLAELDESILDAFQ